MFFQCNLDVSNIVTTICGRELYIGIITFCNIVLVLSIFLKYFLAIFVVYRVVFIFYGQRSVQPNQLVIRHWITL